MRICISGADKNWKSCVWRVRSCIVLPSWRVITAANKNIVRMNFKKIKDSLIFCMFSLDGVQVSALVAQCLVGWCKILFIT